MSACVDTPTLLRVDTEELDELAARLQRVREGLSSVMSELHGLCGPASLAVGAQPMTDAVRDLAGAWMDRTGSAEDATDRLRTAVATLAQGLADCEQRTAALVRLGRLFAEESDPGLDRPPQEGRAW